MEFHACAKRYRALPLLLSLVAALSLILPMPASADEADANRYVTATTPADLGLRARLEDDGNRYVTITAHAGENGYFGDRAVKEAQTTQLRGDIFYFTTEPDAIDSSYTFLGWATTPDAAEANVVSGETPVNSAGTDIYAVWSDKVNVVYYCTEGYVLIDDVEYGQLNVQYRVGDSFREYTPQPYNQYLKFDGWYTGMNGKGTRYTSDTAITEPETVLYAKWVLNPDVIPKMQEDTDYPVTVSGSGQYYAFTPQETAVYEIFTSAVSGEDTQAYIRLLTGDMQDIMDSSATDQDGNVALSTELAAGQTYYFQLRSLHGTGLSYTARLHRPEQAAVTFHANYGDDAWFDGDASVKTKTIRLKAGTELRDFSKSGLGFAATAPISLWGWSADQHAPEPDAALPATDGLDVYAVYHTTDTLLLNANGGYFQMHGNVAVRAFNYQPGEYFVTDYDPAIVDTTKKFAGWATTPDATQPDVEEGKTLCSDLGNEVYAVYADKVVVTFKTDEGYMMDEPSITTFQTTVGKGHVFYGLALMHDDSRMTPVAWKDQDGTTFPYTSEFYPDYRIYEDTTFTAVWGKGVVVDANGGYFLDDPDLDALRITFYIDDPFNSGDITNLVGDPAIDDSEKVLAGWATTPDAARPDVIDGKTDIMGLSRIYAVWQAREAEPDDEDDPDGPSGDDDSDDAGNPGDVDDPGGDDPGSSDGDGDSDDPGDTDGDDDSDEPGDTGGDGNSDASGGSDGQGADDDPDNDDAGKEAPASNKGDSGDGTGGSSADKGASDAGGASGDKSTAAAKATAMPATGDALCVAWLPALLLLAAGLLLTLRALARAKARGKVG